MIVGRDDSRDECTAQYYDSRGVSRVYRMTFAGGVWRMWWDAPGLCQRFAGTLADDGATVTAAWEKSPNGTAWELDFDVLSTRTG